MDKVKKSRERHNCCVPQCSAVKNEENHLHTVPKDPARRKAWAIAIKTGKVLTDTMQVCSRHFKSTDYFPTNGPNLKPKLKKNAVPSENLPVRSHDKINPSPIKRKNQARSDRAAKRSIWSNISADSAADSSTNNENEAPEGEQGQQVTCIEMISCLPNIPNRDHIFLFQEAASETTASTENPLFSMRAMTSRTSLESSSPFTAPLLSCFKVRQSDIMNQCDDDGSDDKEDGDGSHHGSNGMLFWISKKNTSQQNFPKNLENAFLDQCGKTLAAEFSQEQR
ncbi:THAP domain-containing protein 11 [Frankliniella fusca]|uniref:THAP domain-containing protein 11 n=1 Tax=Frankliniella fusca TaxID=407009 RepID=A0AAE1LL86_9NEOP|nr:THAP domain-containing protein 11 [Frankliniella fusca]